VRARVRWPTSTGDVLEFELYTGDADGAARLYVWPRGYRSRCVEIVTKPKAHESLRFAMLVIGHARWPTTVSIVEPSDVPAELSIVDPCDVPAAERVT
jgi:hypothetical protein